MLAIVIPYYKLTFFEAALLSLHNQTNKNFKVYIGNDASPENPDYILQQFDKSLQIVYKKFDTNLGSVSLTQQWHRCIAMVQDEEWILILGDDDVLGLNCVAAFYENLQESQTTNSSVIRFASQVIDENEKAISAIIQHPKIEKVTDFLMRKFKGGTRSTLSEYVFKTEIVKKIKFKDLPLAWYSDLLAVMEFAHWGNIFTINEAVFYFRLSGINITSKTDDSTIKNIATFQFYYYLLSKCHDKFSKTEIQIIFDRIEKTHLDNKKNGKHWKQLFELYSKFFQFKRILLLFLKIKQSIK